MKRQILVNLVYHIEILDSFIKRYFVSKDILVESDIMEQAVYFLATTGSTPWILLSLGWWDMDSLRKLGMKCELAFVIGSVIDLTRGHQEGGFICVNQKATSPSNVSTVSWYNSWCLYHHVHFFWSWSVKPSGPGHLSYYTLYWVWILVNQSAEKWI